MVLRKRSMLLFAGLLISAILTLGCSGGSSEQPTETAVANEPQYGGILQVGTGIVIPVLGYTPSITNNSYMQFTQVAFDSLLFYDEAGNLIPRLAESWEIDADAKTIVFHLREGVQFHDGTPFNAEAVRWNIEQYQEAKRTEVSVVDSVVANEEFTVTVKLKEWNSSALEGIGFFVYYMSPTAFEQNGIEWMKKNPVGTGPFKFVSWEEEVSIVYEKNDNYWREGLPYLDGINFTIIADQTTMTASLQAGELDMFSYASTLQAKQLQDMGGFELEINHNGVGVESQGVIPSSSNPDSPFADPLVRQAFNYAIDRDTLVQALGFGFLVGTNQWAAPGAQTYNPEVEGYPFNPEKARDLLAEAGYPDGFDTTIYAYAGDDWNPAIAQMLTDVGIRAKIELVDGAKLYALMLEGWDGVMYHWASIGPDLGLYMGRHLDPSGAFFAKGIQHPEDALELLSKIRLATDDESKLEYSHELQKLIYDKYALFGKVLFVQAIQTIKYPYVEGDNWTRYTAASWTPETAWLNK